MRSFFNFDIDELLKELDGFQRELAEGMESEIEEIEKAVKSGELRGNWNFKKLNEPGVKGYVVYGRFESDSPIERPKPLRRPLTPEIPFNSQADMEETREPLTDIFEEEKAIKLYVELPGEEKEDIQLNIANGQAEVKAKKFYKTVDLPSNKVDAEKASARYKNGVLEVTIPKTEKTSEKEKRKISVE